MQKSKSRENRYKPERVSEDPERWQIFYQDAFEKRPADDGVLYTKRQAAYYRSKVLNEHLNNAEEIHDIYIRLYAKRQDCKDICKKLRPISGRDSLRVYDPLKDHDPDLRIIVTARRCRKSQESVDLPDDDFVVQPPTDDEFYALLEPIRTMPEVFNFEISFEPYSY